MYFWAEPIIHGTGLEVEASEGKGACEGFFPEGHTLNKSGINFQGKNFLLNSYKSQFPIYNYDLHLLNAHCVPALVTAFYVWEFS